MILIGINCRDDILRIKNEHISFVAVFLLGLSFCNSSAATGFLLDIYKTSGPDSLAGFMSSVILSSTETCFYTLSVYYSVVGIKKIRYTLTGALLAVFVGTFISVFISYF